MCKPTVSIFEARHLHETIVDAICRCPSSPSTGEIVRLMKLIEDTKIPEGHDLIIAAINTYFDFPGSLKWAREVRQVTEHILRQKSLAEEKKKQTINLDELQEQVEKLLNLLNDRQPFYISWVMFVNERLQIIHRLTSQALGK